jgi:prepilin-type processing-associated H-X9-DG protein
MYLSDWDTFPTSNDPSAMLSTIEDYVRNNDVFMRPGTTDEVVVRWLFDPTMPIDGIEDPALYEVAIIDYHPDFYVVAYVDGHVMAFDKKKP